MKRVLLVAAICLIAAPAFASPDILPVSKIKGVTTKGMDPVSGKVYDLGSYDRYGSQIYWTLNQGLFFSWDPADPWLILDWGDLGTPGTGFSVGAMHIIYLANQFPSTPGTNIQHTWIAEEQGHDTTTKIPWARLTISNFPGVPYAPPGWGSGWDFFIDLQSIPWVWVLDGNDLDGDGLIDMGYSYWFYDVPTPETQGMGTLFGAYSPIGTEDGGAEDSFDVYGDPNYVNYYGSYWFGGSPFSQFCAQWLGLGCPNAGTDPPGVFDYCYTDIYPALPGDCVVNIQDLGALLPNYNGTATPYTFAQGDVYPVIFGDGLVNISDLGQLLAQYGDNCND
jgi:hypothetical protein